MMNEKQKAELIKRIQDQIKIHDALINTMRELGLSQTPIIRSIVGARSACIHALEHAQRIEAEPMPPLKMPDTLPDEWRAGSSVYYESHKIWTVEDAIEFLTSVKRYCRGLEYKDIMDNVRWATQADSSASHSFKMMNQAIEQIEDDNEDV